MIRVLLTAAAVVGLGIGFAKHSHAQEPAQSWTECKPDKPAFATEFALWWWRCNDGSRILAGPPDHIIKQWLRLHPGG